MSTQNKSKLEVLQVETTNYCNARCIFCAYDQIEKHGTMADRLYAKILKDAKKLDPPPQTFIPILTGEPFLDPKMVDRIKEARAALPKTEIHLYSNGSKLTEEIIRELAQVPNFHINISANGASVETRKRLTGLGDYEYVARMIDYADEMHISHSVSLVQHPSITNEEEAAFNRRWGKDTSSSSCRSPYLFQHLNFAGLTYEKDKTHFTYCIHATSHMTVLWDGRVNLCCMDPLGRKIFGDLNHQTVSEVWFSQERQYYATMHEGGRGTGCEVCRDCNIVCF
jgi:organic radical activating enzyme